MRVQNKFGYGVVLRKLMMVILIVGARGHGQRRQVCTVYIVCLCYIVCVCVAEFTKNRRQRVSVILLNAVGTK